MSGQQPGPYDPHGHHSGAHHGGHPGLPPATDGRDGNTEHLPYPGPHGQPHPGAHGHQQSGQYHQGHGQAYGGHSGQQHQQHQHQQHQQHQQGYHGGYDQQSHGGHQGYGQHQSHASHGGYDSHAGYGSQASHASHGGQQYGSHAGYAGHASHGGYASHGSHGGVTAATADTPQGTPFGKYILVSELGRGGMGVVYKAHQTDLKRDCALKVLHEANGARLVQEGQAVAKLGKHANIAAVYDAGMEGGVPYIAMEFVKGTPLDDYLEQHGPLTEQRVLEIGYKVALALHHAHRQGVIHRDMKPANVILDGDGEPHVLDFGLAADVVTGEAMYAGSIVGTPSYMPPEQFRAEPGAVDARTDVYALGATLYRLHSGKVPFDGSIREVLEQLLTQAPESLRSMTQCSRDFETVVAKAMEKDPRDRYQSCLEMADDLSQVIAGEPPKSRRLGLIGRALRKAQRNPALVTVAALLVIFGVVAALWLRHQSRESDRLWQDLSRQVAQQTADRTRALLAPAVPLLEETLLFALQDMISVPTAAGSSYPVELRRDLARDLAIRFRVRSLDWMTFVEPDGRFTGVTRRGDDVVANYSWIDGNVSWEVEELIAPDGSARELGQDKQEGEDLYDPRIDDSWTVAKDRSEPVWTDPYEWDVEASLGGGTEWGLSYAAPFRKDGELLGVFTADYTLADLSRFLARITTGEQARSFLITDEGAIVARSDAGEEKVEATDPALTAALSQLEAGAAGLDPDRPASIDFEHEGVRHVAALAKFTLPGDLAWATAVIAPVAALRGTVQQQTAWMIYAGSAGLAVLFIGVLLGWLRRRGRVRRTVQTFGGPSGGGDPATADVAPPAA